MQRIYKHIPRYTYAAYSTATYHRTLHWQYSDKGLSGHSSMREFSDFWLINCKGAFIVELRNANVFVCDHSSHIILIPSLMRLSLTFLTLDITIR